MCYNAKRSALGDQGSDSSGCASTFMGIIHHATQYYPVPFSRRLLEEFMDLLESILITFLAPPSMGLRHLLPNPKDQCSHHEISGTVSMMCI